MHVFAVTHLQVTLTPFVSLPIEDLSSGHGKVKPGHNVRREGN